MWLHPNIILLYSKVASNYISYSICCTLTSECDNINGSYINHYYVGLLAAVGSLTATPILLDSIISLTWTPPFSLDITNVDPDITYCVGVVNSTFSLVIHSQCGITDTQYNYTVSPRSTPCDNYTFKLI